MNSAGDVDILMTCTGPPGYALVAVCVSAAARAFVCNKPGLPPFIV